MIMQVEGDKKARSDAEAKRIESKGKKDLLEAALKRYKTLDIMGGVFDEDEGKLFRLLSSISALIISSRAGADDDGQGLNRRPVSGTLQITIKSARDLDHLPTNRRKPTETVVVVKVEDTPRARTYPSRTDRWNEDFELHVDKANEVEVTIYDKPPGTNETPTPIGMLWIRLSDVVDELRRKKVGAEAGAGWVTAAGVEGGSNITPPGTGQMGHRPTGSMGGLDAPVAAQLPPNAQSAAMRPGTAVDGIDAWFSVEPAGQIDLHLNFGKHTSSS
jgi:classical protein kinase C